MYHCRRAVKEYCSQVSSASVFGLTCGREDKAAASSSLSASTLVYGKGEHSVAAALKEGNVITCSYRSKDLLPIFPEGTILRQWC